MYRQFKPIESLGFGYGAHRCIAEYLAKTELEIVFGECQVVRSPEWLYGSLI